MVYAHIEHQNIWIHNKEETALYNLESCTAIQKHADVLIMLRFIGRYEYLTFPDQKSRDDYFIFLRNILYCHGDR